MRRIAVVLGCALAGLSVDALPVPIEGPETWLELYGGNVRKDGLRCDLEAIKAAGISGVHLFHIGNRNVVGADGVMGTDQPWPDCPEQIPVLSEKWGDLITYLGEECVRLGLGLVVQNCPGWSQSGGPWVPLSACMRELRVARTDVAAGAVAVLPPVPDEYRDVGSDWKDVAVLAFPTPKDDTGAELKPVASEGEGDVVTYRFAEPVTVRTLALPPLNRFNHRLAYHMPWLRARLTALDAEGGAKVTFDRMLPVSNWRDDDGDWTISLACEECRATTWKLEYVHALPIRRYDAPKFFSAARQTDWEGKSGLTLRSLMRARAPRQDPACWVKADAVVDLTDRVKDGAIDWSAPSGDWTVLRFGHVNTKRVNAPAPKEATGWECDKLAPEGIEACFRGYMGRLLGGELKGKVRGMLVDSWECFGQTWTPKMERYFRKANGYEVRRKLPALFGWVLDDPTKTEDFLTDWRRTIGDLITRNYFGRMAELAHESGIEAFYETAIGDIVPGDILEYWKYADAPMCEFWRPHNSEEFGSCGSYAFKPIRPCASAAHIYGKRRVIAEAFTGSGISWCEDFKEMRDLANRHFARGVTHLAFQSYTHAPAPDALPPGGCMGGYNGTPFTRLQTWWKHMPEFTGWLARCERFLENGLPAQDILWYLGDAVDHKPDENYPLPEGYRADYLNHDVLTNRLAVKDGCFTVPEGTAWRILWVPDDYRLLPSTKAKLAELSAAGGKVVWGGKDALLAAIAELGLKRDVATEPSVGDGINDDFTWIHRRVGDSDRYFVAAGTNGFRGKVTFRAEGVATVFDPVTQERKAWCNGDEMALFPSQSVFVEFGLESGEAMSSSLQKGTIPRFDEAERIPLLRSLGPWTLSFPNGKTLTLDAPASWSSLKGLSCEEQAFGGTATYRTSFDYDPAAGRVELDLGEVETIAEVFVNDVKVRTLWCVPYRCDISRYVVSGKNEICIEVTNTWRNRVIYDLGQPVEKRKTWILCRKGFNPSKDDPFIPAGLVGPVRLKFTLPAVWAEFISPAERREGRTVAAFRKEFRNEKTIRRAIWSLTALGVYEATVNGRPVGDGVLSPGYTENGKCRQVSVCDVTAALRRGAGEVNELGARVAPTWWCDQLNVPPPGRTTPWQLGREVAFRGELRLEYEDGSTSVIGTGSDWLASYSGSVLKAGLYEGETVDRRQKVGDFRPAKINREFDGELRPMSVKTVVREDLALSPRTISVLKGAEGATADAFGRARVVRGYHDGDEIRLDAGEQLVVDFGQNCSALPSIRLAGEAGTALEIRPVEMLNEANGEKARGNDGPAGTPYLSNLRSAYAGIRYTLGGGEEEYRPVFTFFGYRCLAVTATGPVKFRSFRSLPVSSITPEMECGSIETGNEKVNRLIANVRWGMLSNYLSIPTDCPQRDERFGWMADTQVFMETGAYLADTFGFLSKYLSDMRDAQFPDGLYPCFLPNCRHVFPHWASCGWTDAGVIIPYRLWKRYGRTDVIRNHWDSMLRYMDFLERHDRPYRINHGDWLAFEHVSPTAEAGIGQRTDYLEMMNAMFRVWMASLMREMSAALGRPGDARRFAEQEGILRKAFADAYLDADGMLKASFRGQCSDLYMLKLGLCGNAAAVEATKEDLVANIRGNGNRLKTGFLGTAILMPTLTFEADAPDVAYDLLLQEAFPSWLYSVDQGATTVWERWNSYTKEKGFGPTIMNSFNHYAYGCVLEWLFSAAAGIRADPSVPGFRHFILRPYPDRRLGSLKASYRSPAGMIRSSWAYGADGRLRWTFEIPEGATASVTTPGGRTEELGAGRYER